MTDAERAAFYAELETRAKRLQDHAAAALVPWADYMCNTMTDRQRYRVAAVAAKTVEQADYFAKEPKLDIAIQMRRLARGRPGSPNGIFSVDVDVRVPGRDFSGAHGHAIIGQRAAVKGSIFEYGLCGRTVEL